MKVTAALVALLACAYFQTTSAVCQKGHLMLLMDGINGKPRPGYLVSFENGDQQVLAKPAKARTMTGFIISPAQGNKVKFNELVIADWNVFMPGQECEITVENSFDYQIINCGDLTLSHRCI